MSRTRLIVIAAAVVVVLAVGSLIVYDQVLRGDSAAALTLPTAAPASVASVDPTGTASTATGTSSAPAASFSGSVAGTWNVAADSVAGYRVREQLANLPAQSDAVGRTSSITGSITLETSGSTTTVTAGQLTVDTTSITSDKPQRDNRLRNEGFQTDTYPTATFKLTKAVEVPAAALAGTPSDVTLTGDLTLHGVTKSVEIPAKAQLVNGTISVAGSLTFPLSDYSIVAPNLGGIIVSIADTGTLEFLVNFSQG
jgi:polyisoprenoid-binding protein YceI